MKNKKQIEAAHLTSLHLQPQKPTKTALLAATNHTQGVLLKTKLIFIFLSPSTSWILKKKDTLLNKSRKKTSSATKWIKKKYNHHFTALSICQGSRQMPYSFFKWVFTLIRSRETIVCNLPLCYDWTTCLPCAAHKTHAHTHIHT